MADSISNKVRRGLTFIELLVALMVAAIIFTAVATLSHAMGVANDCADDIARNQAQVRYTTARLTNLIGHSLLVTLAGAGDDLAVWRADDNADGQINPAELVYIEAGAARNKISLLEFPGAPSWSIPLDTIVDGLAKSSLLTACDERRTDIIPQCGNVQFYPADINPQSRFVGISFDLTEDGSTRRYQLSAHVRCWAGHLIDGSNIVFSDDD